jgi:transposase
MLQCIANETAVATFSKLGLTTYSQLLVAQISNHRLSRSEIMAPFTTQEMRKNMVFWCFEQHKTALEISKLAQCSERMVYSVLRLHCDYGQVTNPFSRRGRPRVLDPVDIQYIHALLQANPTLYLVLDELQEQLFAAQDKDVSLATISRAIRKLAMTHKCISKTAAERDEFLRATWQGAYGDIPTEYFVWLDESSVDDKTNQRTRGWADLGSACVRRATFIRGQHYSVLPALSSDGIIALDIFEGSVNKERFMQFLSVELVCHIFLLGSVPYSMLPSGFKGNRRESKKIGKRCSRDHSLFILVQVAEVETQPCTDQTLHMKVCPDIWLQASLQTYADLVGLR